MSEKLKPCPFCGGEAKVKRFFGCAYITVGCKKCNVQINRDTKKAAIAAWNTRIKGEQEDI